MEVTFSGYVGRIILSENVADKGGIFLDCYAVAKFYKNPFVFLFVLGLDGHNTYEGIRVVQVLVWKFFFKNSHPQNKIK